MVLIANCFPSVLMSASTFVFLSMPPTKYLRCSYTHTVDGKTNPPLQGLFKGIRKEYTCFLLHFMHFFGFYVTDFWFFPGVLEGLGSSGRLVRTISTHPGTYKCPWSRVRAKNPPGGYLFYRPRHTHIHVHMDFAVEI